MSKKQSRESATKRQTIKEQRTKKQRQQRLTLIFGIGIVALVVAGLIIWPNYQRAKAPVGQITQITPVARPNANGTSAGDPNAPVLVEVYEDFQCPSCRQYSESIEPQVMQNYVDTGKVHYVFRHYPFIDSNSSTKESHQAANASMCASDQGRFWDYHDMLFTNWNGENQGSFTDKRLQAFAQALGLDMNAFNACFSANKYQDKINEDFAAGQKAGVSGTPSVFVDGTQVTPGFIPSYEEMQKAIDAALAAKNK